MCGPGRDSQSFSQLPDLITCGRKFGLACRKHLRKRRSDSGWAIETPKLDSDRSLGGTYSIEGEDGGCKETSRNARKRLGIPMAMQNGNKEVLKWAAGHCKRDCRLHNPKDKSVHALWKIMNPRESVAEIEVI